MPYLDAAGVPIAMRDRVEVLGNDARFEVRGLRPEGVAVIWNLSRLCVGTSTVPLSSVTRIGGPDMCGCGRLAADLCPETGVCGSECPGWCCDPPCHCPDSYRDNGIHVDYCPTIGGAGIPGYGLGDPRGALKETR